MGCFGNVYEYTREVFDMFWRFLSNLLMLLIKYVINAVRIFHQK